MRKIAGLVCAVSFLFVFESCSKEKVQPTVNNTKSNASQQSASGQSQSDTPPASQPPSCSPPSCPPSCPHASGNPVNAG